MDPQRSETGGERYQWQGIDLIFLPLSERRWGRLNMKNIFCGLPIKKGSPPIPISWKCFDKNTDPVWPPEEPSIQGVLQRPLLYSWVLPKGAWGRCCSAFWKREPYRTGLANSTNCQMLQKMPSWTCQHIWPSGWRELCQQPQGKPVEMPEPIQSFHWTLRWFVKTVIENWNSRFCFHLKMSEVKVKKGKIGSKWQRGS